MRLNRILLNAPLILTVALTAATTATAAQVQTSFQVTSSVASSCKVTAVELVFGVYNGSQNDKTSTITVACTAGVAYRVGLDNGLYYSAPNRRMKHRTTAHYLNYELYRDAARTNRWGNDDSSDIHMTSDSTVQHLNVYGRVPAGQSGPLGSYSNTTMVTVNF